MTTDDLPETLELSDLEFEAELRFLAAANLFELEKVSSGKAAEMAGLSRMAFLRRLDDISVPALSLSDEETDAESAAARELAG